MTAAQESIEPTYLIDTCVISDFIKGQSGVVSRMLSLAPGLIAISTISQMEVEYGLLLHEARARKLRPKIGAFFDSVLLLPFSEKDALAAATIRSELKRQGILIGPYDILLAGTALNRELILVTSNTNEFQRVKSLKIENWR